jgi:hypothetical protein
MKLFLILVFSIISSSGISQMKRADTAIIITPFIDDDSMATSYYVAIDIQIDSAGNTIFSKFQPIGSNTSDTTMIGVAKRKALKIKWNHSSYPLSEGTVIFKFKVLDKN